MASRLSHIHDRIKHHGNRAAEHVKRMLGRKDIPTELVDDDEMDFASSPVKFPVLSKVKLVRLRKAEDFDTIRTMLQMYDIILIHVAAFQNVDELKRGIGRIKLLPSRGIKCQMAGLDPHWLVVTSENVEMPA